MSLLVDINGSGELDSMRIKEKSYLCIFSKNYE